MMAIKNNFFLKVPAVKNRWNDDWLDERLLERFERKEKGGQLLRQKLNKVVTVFNENVSLDVCPDGYVRLGTALKLVHHGLGLQSPKTCLAANFSSATLLGSHCDPSLLIHKSWLPVSAMKDDRSTARNAFVIARVDGSVSFGTPLCYGDTFSLCAVIGNEKRFLHSINQMGYVTSCSLHQEVVLTQHASQYTQWKALSTNPENNLEMEGKPLTVNVPVVLNHVSTNQNLCHEPHQIKTIFGTENEVSVHSYLNGRRRAVDGCNVWSFVGSQPGS